MSEQMEFPETFEKYAKEYGFKDDKEVYTNGSYLIPVFRVKQWLEHDNKITVEEYRQRMIKAFHNADCDELIAVCVLPTEKEFKYLEWLLRSHYKKEPCEDPGEISDGYHTFNQLYHQRAILFATIVNQNKDKAWKSYKHSDGKYCFDSNGEWFIVGVDTPKGSYTYHYSKEYWDMFDCKELDCGKEWDGHTEEDVTRLLSLEEQESCEDAISRQAVLSMQYRIDDSATLSTRDVVDVDDIEDLPSVTPQYTDAEIQKMQELEQAEIEKAYELGKAESEV